MLEHLEVLTLYGYALNLNAHLFFTIARVNTHI